MFWPDGIVVLCVGVFLLFKTIGLAALGGLMVLIVQMPVVSAFGWLYGKYSEKVQTATDERLHLTQEVIQAIRIVKSFAWQQSFAERLDEKRNIELRYLRYRLATQVGFVCSFLCGSIFVYVSLWYQL
jgi:ABC-type multidrug transport system fused ATPase/permease subunit